MIYSYSESNNHKTLVLLFSDQEPVVINDTHPEWESVWPGTEYMSEDEVKGILYPDTASDWLEDEPVGIYGLTVDGMSIEESSISNLLRALGNREDTSEEHLRAIERFLEKAKDNPKAENLYRWISKEKLTIDSSGDIIGYKGLNTVSEDKFDHFFGTGKSYNGDPIPATEFLEEFSEAYTPSRPGGGVSDGVFFPGYIPQVVGSVVEMARDDVDDNGKVECSVGLHVGTYSYASSFAPNVVLVKVNPRDVISVPDYDFHKMRTCRYRIIGECTSELDSNFYVEDQYAPIIPAEEDSEPDIKAMAIEILRSMWGL